MLERSSEHALLNPDNEIILAGHLACAAAELPIDLGERNPVSTRNRVSGLLEDLVAAGQLYRGGDRYYWAGVGNPSAAVGLRTSSPDRIVIQAADVAGKPQAIGELDRYSVPLLLYEGAIYPHEGMTYLVERLDWDAGVAHIRPAEVDFYTRPSIGQEVEVLTVKATTEDDGRRMTNDETDDERRTTDDGRRTTDDYGSPSLPASSFQLPASSFQLPASSFQLSRGDVRAISRATGYKILRRATNEVLGFGTIDLPEQTLETQACWLAFSEALIERLKAAGEWFSDPNEYGPNWPAQRNAARAAMGSDVKIAAWPSRTGCASTTCTIGFPSARSWPTPACALALTPRTPGRLQTAWRTW